MSENAKTTIRPNVEAMNKSKSASGTQTLSCGDHVAQALEGWPLDNIRALAVEMDIYVEKYNHLNPGHQRMVLGNMFRKRINDREKIEEGTGVDWFDYLSDKFAPEPVEEVEEEAA